VTFKDLQKLVQSSQSNTEQTQLFKRLKINQSGYKMYDQSLGPRIGVYNSSQMTRPIESAVQSPKYVNDFVKDFR
jgi:hypothetical protein